MRAPDAKRRLGALGEEIALDHLIALGFELLVRNWRCRGGELDLVMQEGEWLVFVEVRARRAPYRGATPTFGPPEESLVPRKLARLAALSEAYLATHPWTGPYRVDVIALVLRDDDSVLRLNHLRDAVGGLQ